MVKISKEKLEAAQDVIKSLLQWIVVSACGFVYWMGVLLLISIFLMNIWSTNFDQILKIGIVLAVITSVAYAVILVRRRLK